MKKFLISLIALAIILATATAWNHWAIAHYGECFKAYPDGSIRHFYGFQ